MKIQLFRHAAALARTPGVMDAAQSLQSTGTATFHGAERGLGRMLVRLDRLVTDPLTRARHLVGRAGANGRRTPALTRVASTGIYLVRNISPELQRTARARATRESTTLTEVLEQARREYAAGSWTPQPRRDVS